MNKFMRTFIIGIVFYAIDRLWAVWPNMPRTHEPVIVVFMMAVGTIMAIAQDFKELFRD
jgi:hypothetical protein